MPDFLSTVSANKPVESYCILFSFKIAYHDCMAFISFI